MSSSLYDIRELLDEAFKLGRVGKVTYEAFTVWRDEKLERAYGLEGEKHERQ